MRRLIPIILIVFSLGMVEIEVLEMRKSMEPPEQVPDARPFASWPSYLAKARLSKKHQGQELYSTLVEHDQYGFRSYPSIPKVKDYKRHLFLVGCSLTFGEGVQDEDTWAYLLAMNEPKTRVVNMGKRGGSIMDALYYWKYVSWNQIYPEQDGLMIFTIFEDHFERVSRSWRYLSWVTATNPFFEFDGKELKYQGVVGDGLDFKFLQYMKKFGLEYYWLRGTHVTLPYTLKGSNALMADLLLELKNQYLSKFPKGKFVVSHFGNFKPRNDPQNSAAFALELKKRNIELWENRSSESVLKTSESFAERVIKHDGHPNALANREYADFLTQALRAGDSN